MPKLKVFLAGATDLKVADITGSSDPYVRLCVNGSGANDGKGGKSKEQKTKVRKRSLNPKWGDVFYFDIAQAADTRLEINVFDWDRFKKDDPLGFASIDLGTVPPNTDHPATCQLDTQGEVKLELHLEDQAAASASAYHAPVADMNLAPAPMQPMTGDQFQQQPIITQDPFGVVYFGQPVTPQPAYPGQSMPPPYLYTPPPAYYAPPPAALPQYDQYTFAMPDVAVSFCFCFCLVASFDPQSLRRDFSLAPISFASSHLFLGLM
jgi:C2 domain